MNSITTAALLLALVSTNTLLAAAKNVDYSWRKDDHENTMADQERSSLGGAITTPSNIEPRELQTCQDAPGWYDSSGDDCDWYAGFGRCFWLGWLFSNNGLNANQACCVCGGGSIVGTDGGGGDNGGNEGDVVFGLQPSCNFNIGDGFHMCLDLVSSSNSYKNWMEAFAKAQKRWERIIVGDLPSTPSNLLDTRVSGTQITCTGYPANIDDVYICGREEYIDGSGGVLGAALPIYTKGSGVTNPRTKQEYRVTVSGLMFFDSADITKLVNNGSFDDVVFHEMGHVLGAGTLWVDNGLFSESNPSEYASGTRAEKEWRDLGCSGPLPVETDGGEGTAGGHWDEDCLNHEVMSGFLSGFSQPVSSITIGTFEDMGYEVSFDEADSFSLSNLGSCGSFCPEARGFGRRLRSSQQREKRKLEGMDLETVMKFAKTQLTAIHNELRLSPVNHSDENGIRVVEEIDILFQDDSGTIHGVHVTWDQVKDLNV